MVSHVVLLPRLVSARHWIDQVSVPDKLSLVSPDLLRTHHSRVRQVPTEATRQTRRASAAVADFSGHRVESQRLFGHKTCGFLSVALTKVSSEQQVK